MDTMLISASYCCCKSAALVLHTAQSHTQEVESVNHHPERPQLHIYCKCTATDLLLNHV